ncbi:MAG TPA: serine/threonine-protein kinase [Polyangiaceae bacterium]|nr:serine/threonine-protein kinase [Polyangiaceae bacterium]
MSQDRFGIVGKIIARTYEIRKVVAEGGFGVVYRAYHRGFRAEVALKCLKIPVDLTEEQRRAFLEQFRGEAEVLFRLSAHNSNIVRPLHVDAFQTPSAPLVPFMALEWLEGRTLDALIAQRRENGRPPLTLTKLIQLLTPVAAALEQAHNLPGKDGLMVVIHRDMKPENLFIARVGTQDVAKVLDFGISKVKSTASQMAGRASAHADAFVSFSPAYGAPEQWAPRRYGQTGRWTDVWGLALTVVEAAKGEEVIQGDHSAMMGTILDPVRRPTPRNEGITVSDQVEQVFARALAVDPRSRYQTVGEFWDDLTRALDLTAEVGTVSLRHDQLSSVQLNSGLDSLAPAQTPADLTPALAPRRPAPAIADSLRASPPGAAARPASAAQPGAAARPMPAKAPLPMTQPLVHTSLATPLARGAGNLPEPAVSAYPRRSIWKALGPALSFMAVSVLITVLDRAVAHMTGVPLTLGPVHLSWVAGGFMVIALGLAVSVLKRAMDD